jgi:hypothetical protein
MGCGEYILSLDIVRNVEYDHVSKWSNGKASRLFKIDQKNHICKTSSKWCVGACKKG